MIHFPLQSNYARSGVSALTVAMCGVGMIRSGDEWGLTLIIAALGAIVLLLLWRRPPSPAATPHPSEAESAQASQSQTEADFVAARLATIWERSPLAMTLLDPHSPDRDIIILDCNQAACELHGYTREELIGQSIDILEETPWTQWRDSWLSNLREKGRVEGQSSHRRKDGTIFPTEYFTCLVKVEDREVVIGMDHDVTDRRAAELAMKEARDEAEAANRAKSDFLAVMSHEIRTPMNGILGFTNLLHDTELNAEQRDWLSTIRSSGETLLTLINDVLDFSKIESGKMEMDLQPARITRCIEEVVGLLWSKANEKEIELLSWVDPAVPDWVTTDITRFRQVVLNLVGNAIKFTPRGEIEVHAKPHAPIRPGGRDCLAITVRDTGIGVPPDRRDRLFQPFMQADSSTTREYGGTGLGLAISRRLAELMDGSIELVASSAKGSTFELIVAAPACSPPPDAIEHEFLDESALDLTKKRALIVDDNETNCRILTSLLRRWNMETETFYSGDSALKRMENGPPFDIVLLDMMMPGMNGMEVAHHIRASAAAAELPLLLLSSVGHDELRRMGDIKIFDTILHKPVRQSGLFDAVLDAFAIEVDKNQRSAHPFDSGKRTFALDHPLDILVAEDNKVNRKLIHQVLSRLGYAPTLVENGRDCLDALRERPYDIILMDCQMPVIDGYEATGSIRRGEVGLDRSDVHVVALTAAAMVGDRERCIEAGMDDYLSKPIRSDELIKVLDGSTRRIS
ncbi:response regulator [Synoicihabitans lomoniglobus]|uniref:Sensory/regulatory protein RpfC n=1 Tax=Synoicihabitans lomoniglobus TaxID=2909285 RepID=A0AAF0I2B5_9BACT|nr:response regulator [Opitutaceae bacterium LMO-M01]WED66402.1 response regulator [Opitutaceae bacterium LMO-M01]